MMVQQQFHQLPLRNCRPFWCTQVQYPSDHTFQLARVGSLTTMKTLQAHYERWLKVVKQKRYDNECLLDTTYFQAINAQFQLIKPLDLIGAWCMVNQEISFLLPWQHLMALPPNLTEVLAADSNELQYNLAIGHFKSHSLNHSIILILRKKLTFQILVTMNQTSSHVSWLTKKCSTSPMV